MDSENQIFFLIFTLKGSKPPTLPFSTQKESGYVTHNHPKTQANSTDHNGTKGYQHQAESIGI